MSNFINLVVREKVEGTPGVIDDEEFNIHINANQVTLFNKGEDPKVTFVRLVCGATLCVLMPHDKFVKKLKEAGATMFDALPKPKVIRKKKK